ncbi:carbohydrate kinase family protein [Paenibacillus puerhi]|uniref:carbohydrate kinase family protein n=1 Tax=Paenibacillus puerhi TaxID=2692622 RepID=UPI001356EC7A|nr:carbohydrate kinase [Paenibacillus puerhi]
MFDVIAMGELLMDMTPHGYSKQGQPLFEANPGGAPANVLALLAKHGKKTAFIGKVGHDRFGTELREVLERLGIDSSGLITDPESNTTLAFVHLDEAGDRSFEFFRKPGADTRLTAEELDHDLIRQAKIFHFGGLSLTKEPVRSATLAALQIVRKLGGILVSFDPNYREDLWPSEEAARQEIQQVLAGVDVLKLSLEELQLLTSTKDLEEGTKRLFEQYGIALILVTLGAEGSFYRTASKYGLVKGIQVKPIDTTGAGDAFFGAVLAQITEYEPLSSAFEPKAVRTILAYANKVGAIVTTKMGAIPAMPDQTIVHTFK